MFGNIDDDAFYRGRRPSDERIRQIQAINERFNRMFGFGHPGAMYIRMGPPAPEESKQAEEVDTKTLDALLPREPTAAPIEKTEKGPYGLETMPELIEKEKGYMVTLHLHGLHPEHIRELHVDETGLKVQAQYVAPKVYGGALRTDTVLVPLPEDADPQQVDRYDKGDTIDLYIRKK